jgi:hypothetical protein
LDHAFKQTLVPFLLALRIDPITLVPRSLALLHVDHLDLSLALAHAPQSALFFFLIWLLIRSSGTPGYPWHIAQGIERFVGLGLPILSIRKPIGSRIFGLRYLSADSIISLFGDDLQIELIFLPDYRDVIVQIGAIQIYLKEYCGKEREDYGEEECVSSNDHLVSFVVVVGDASNRIVQIAEHDEQVFCQEEQSANDADIDVELLLKGPNREDVKDMWEFYQKHNILKYRLPRKETYDD